MSLVKVKKVPLLASVTSTGAGAAVGPQIDTNRTFQAYGTTSTGSGAATVKIEANNSSATAADGYWVTLGTITLTLGTTVTNDGFATDAAWVYTRANVTALSGTGATVSCDMGAGV